MTASKKQAKKKVAKRGVPAAVKAKAKLKDETISDKGNGCVVGLKKRIRNQSETWMLQTRDSNQKVVRRKIGNAREMPLKTARQIAKDLKIEIQTGKSQKKKAGKSIQELVELYINDRLTSGDIKETTAKEYKEVVKRYATKLMKMSINDERLNIEYVHNWYRDGSKVRAKKDYAFRILNACFGYAEQMEWIGRNVFAIWGSNSNNRYKKNKREGFIEQEDLQKFLHGLLNSRSTTGRDACMLMLSTGMRLTECRLLKWDEVDFDKEIIRLDETRVKNKKEFEVVLNSLALSILKTRYKDKESDFVFAQSSDPSKPIDNVRKILKNAGGISAHDLRRTFATYLRLNPIGEKLISQLMNHRSGSITHDYMITGREELREATQLLSNFINQQMEVVLKARLIDDQLTVKETLTKDKEYKAETTRKRGGVKSQLEDRYKEKQLIDTVVVKTNNAIELTIYPDERVSEKGINVSVDLEVVSVHRFFADDDAVAAVKNKKRMVHERRLTATQSSNRPFFADRFNKFLRKKKNIMNSLHGRDVGFGVFELTEGTNYDLAIMLEDKESFTSKRCIAFSKDFYATKDKRFIEVFE